MLDNAAEESMIIVTRRLATNDQSCPRRSAEGSSQGVTSQPRLHDKCVAYVDILRSNTKVEAIERDEDTPLSGLLEFCSSLSYDSHVSNLAEYGSIMFSERQCIARSVDHEIT